jgi:DNA-binding beta-propeller fold protein YncE
LTKARSIGLLLSLTAMPALAQDPGGDLLRSLTKPLPLLRVDRVELKAIPSLTFEGISAIATDAQGNIFVLHRPMDGDPIVVLDPKGKVLRSWGKGMFKIPHGIRLDPAGNVWTVDANTSRVFKFTPQGRKLLEISVGDIPDPAREFCGATDVAFAANGRIFVADGYCNARVIEYDSTGRKVRQWGRPGTGPGEFDVVHAIVVGPQGNLYVADRENGRLQWFTPDGAFLGQWKFGGQLYNVAFATTGEMYVSTHPKDVSLDEEFDVVKVDPATGQLLGRFRVRSHELAIGPDGALFPATRSGQLLLLRPRQ